MTQSHTADDGRTDSDQSNTTLGESVNGPDEPSSGTAADTATIDAGRIEHLDATDRQRHLRTRKADYPNQEEVSARIHDHVSLAMAQEQRRVVQAPNGANKTGIAAETRWLDRPETTGGDPVVLFCETTAQRNESIERAEAAGLDTYVLRGSDDLCSMLSGEHDHLTIDGEPVSEWMKTRLRGRGVQSFDYVHDWAVNRLEEQGDTPACCPGDDECPSVTRWPDDGFVDDDGDPRYDLIITTGPFAFVPSLRDGTNVIIDEQPDYSEDFGLNSPTPDQLTARLREAANLQLEQSDHGPDSWAALIQAARKSAHEYADELATYDDNGADEWIVDLLYDQRLSAVREFYDEPDLDWYMETPGSHVIAQPIIRAVWKALHGEPGNVTDADDRGGGVFDENGRASATVRHRPGWTDGEANWSWVTVVIDDQNTIRSVRNTPDFSTARSVIGLDAYPTMPLWQQNVSRRMRVERTLTPTESRLFRRFEQGQTVVEMGTADRPAGTGGRYLNENHLDAVSKALVEQYGEAFRTAGAPKALKDSVESTMADHGVDDPEVMTYGQQNSRNDFGEEEVGLVYSCIDAGDDYVLNLLSECGLDAVPERSDAHCDHCEGEGCRQCNGTGLKREHGRGFTGPDTDEAMALLESVRGHQVAQMVGRYGRALDVKAGEHNITYVATGVLSKHPSTRHLVDYRTEGVIHTETALERRLVEYVDDNRWSTTRDIADAVDCSKVHVIRVLEDVQGISRRRGTGKYGADEWAVSYDDVSLDIVDLGEDIVTSDVWSSSTWEVTVQRVERPCSDSGIASREKTPSRGGATGVDPPP